MGAESTAQKLVSDLDGDEDTLEQPGAPNEQLPPPPRSIPGLRLEGKTFTEFQDFSNVTFTKPVILKNVRFTAGCCFDKAVFLKRVNFSGVQIAGAAGSLTSFQDCDFQAMARFDKSTLYLANFSRSIFRAASSFRSVRFNASAKFDDVQFAGAVGFVDAIFSGSGNFCRGRFEDSADFGRAEFRYWLSHARFNETQFNGLAAFNEAQFSGNADFENAQFLGGATFSAARFSERLEDDAGNTQEPSSNPAPRADLAIRFVKAQFACSEAGEYVSFESAKFGDRNFTRDADFSCAIFLSPKKAGELVVADFGQLDCSGGLSFRDAEFQAGVALQLSGAKLERDLDLTGAKISSASKFERAQFREGILLSQTVFLEIPDFRQATFNHRPSLHEAKFPAKPSASSREQRQLVLQCIQTLKRLAEQSDDKRTANEMLVHELKLEGGVASLMYGAISNYGRSWLRPALWLVFLTLTIFPLLHLTLSGRLPGSVDELRTVAQSLGPACVDGKDGNALAAAMELSVKNAMVVAAENEARTKRIAECLGAADKAAFQSVGSAILEAFQFITSAILVFFIGSSVRRRLQVRA